MALICIHDFDEWKLEKHPEFLLSVVGYFRMALQF